jgi:hypothetical protein
LVRLGRTIGPLPAFAAENSLPPVATILSHGGRPVTLEEIFFISQIIAAVGIVGSLIFVGLQVMESAKAVRSATAQAVHDNYAGWYITLADNERALTTSAKGFVDLGALTPAEKAQFVCIFMAFMSHSQNAFHQWRQGHLADELWMGWEALMMNLVNTPGGAAFWRERSYVFGQDFQDQVALIMKRTPHPAAKAFGVVPVGPVAADQASKQNGT